MFLFKSLSFSCLGNSADFHTARRRAAQNLSVWFAPEEARTPSWRPGGNLRGHISSGLLKTPSNSETSLTGTNLNPPSPALHKTPLLRQHRGSRLLWTMADRSSGRDGFQLEPKTEFSAAENVPWPARKACCSNTRGNTLFYLVAKRHLCRKDKA